MLIRYHILRRTKRTTVSLDTTLSALLSLKLNTEPATPQAHAAIGDWIQTCVDEEDDPGRDQISQWVQSELTLFLVDRKLYGCYEDWLHDRDGSMAYWRMRKRNRSTAHSDRGESESATQPVANE